MEENNINKEIEKIRKWERERVSSNLFQHGKSLMISGLGLVVLSISFFAIKDVVSLPLSVPIVIIAIGFIGTVLGAYLMLSNMLN